MTCTGNSDCFPRGKRAPIVRWAIQLPPPPLVFSCFHTTVCEAYSFKTDGYGIFNVRTHVGACRTHEGGSGTNKSAQELTRGTEKLFLAPPRKGIEPKTFGFQFRLSNH